MNTSERSKIQAMLYRKLAVLYLGGKCIKCGHTQRLNLHHKDNNPENNEVSNIELLCVSCHQRGHKRTNNHPVTLPEGKVKVVFTIPNSLMTRIKSHCKKHGDLQKIIREALELYIQAHPQPIDCEAT